MEDLYLIAKIRQNIFFPQNLESSDKFYFFFPSLLYFPFLLLSLLFHLDDKFMTACL